MGISCYKYTWRYPAAYKKIEKVITFTTGNQESGRAGNHFYCS